MDQNIHNWYELEVLNRLAHIANDDSSLSDEMLSDVACVALNHLPARYVRHTVDVSFYTSQEDRLAMEAKIEASIKNALDFVRSHPHYETA